MGRNESNAGGAAKSGASNVVVPTSISQGDPSCARSTTWGECFKEGVARFKAGDFEGSIVYFNEALESGGGQNSSIYDSRAAAYEKLGRLQDALQDARVVISLSKQRWQGYGRAARLFQKTRKFDASVRMADLALERLKNSHHDRRVELEEIKATGLLKIQKLEAQRSRCRYHFGVLPVEVITEIFQLLILDDIATLLKLSRVCSHWRTILLATPALWGNLVLTHRKPVKKVKLWLERSKGRIHQLKVGSAARSEPAWSDQLLVGMKWEHLRSCSVVGWDLPAFLQSISMPHILGNLQELEVSQVSDVVMDNYLLDNAQLRHLCVSDVVLPCKTIADRLKQLTSLSLSSSSAGNVLAILKENPMLERLVIAPPLPFMDGQPDADPEHSITLPYLTHLEIIEYFRVKSFIEHIDCPALQTLRLRCASLRIDTVLFHLINMAPVHLTTLSIIDARISVATNLINVLRLAPNLTHLELNKLFGVVNPLLEALAVGPLTIETSSTLSADLESASPQTASQTSLCPTLVSLNLSQTDVKTGPLVRTIKYRNGETSSDFEEATGMARIASLVIDRCDLVDPQWLPWIRSAVGSVSCIYVSKQVAKRGR